MTTDKDVKQILRAIQNNDVLKVVSDSKWEFTAPKPIATALQVEAEVKALGGKAVSAFVTGFGPGAISSKSIHGGVVAGAANALTKTGRYILEHKEDAYARIKKAQATGNVVYTLPFSEVARTTRDGRVLETLYDVASGTIKTYSPQDNLKFTREGVFWKR